MRKPAHILIIGNDPRLLAARAQVLLNFWTVSAITPFDDSTDLRTVDLLVLCHTLEEWQRQHWIAAFRLHHPIGLVVSLDFLDGIPRGGTDARVDHSNGPGALVSVIYELLTERGLPSKAWLAGGRTLHGSTRAQRSS